MKQEGLQGVVFGAMEGLVMVMGLLMGFALSIPDRSIVLLAIIVTAIADAFSNPASLYAEEESEKHKPSVILRATVFSFFSTLIAYGVPTLPMLFLPVRDAAFMGLAIGVSGLVGVGWIVAKLSGKKWQKIVVKYLFIGLLVSTVTYFIGTLF